MATDRDWPEIMNLLAQSQEVQERVNQIERATSALLDAANRGEFNAALINQVSTASLSVEAELDRLLARVETLLKE